MRVASVATRSSQASATDDPALAAPNDPPEPAAGGRSLSPSTTSTHSTGKPNASPAICARMV